MLPTPDKDGLDEHGNPILYDVSHFHTLEGVNGAPVGTWLTKANGRRFKVTADLPLSPAYLRDYEYYTRMKARAALARQAKSLKVVPRHV